jgi:hypothetical protein
MKNLILFLALITSITALGQDTTNYSHWVEGGKVSNSETIFIVEILDTDDVIIDIISECDTISLSSSDYTKKVDMLRAIIDSNDEGIESILMIKGEVFVLYSDGKTEKKIEFIK